MSKGLEGLISEINRKPTYQLFGRVTGILGLLVEISGTGHMLSIGSRVSIKARNGQYVKCEIIGFKEGKALAMPYDSLEGVGIGSKAFIENAQPVVSPSPQWLGRVINALGEPIDGKGSLQHGDDPVQIKGSPPLASTRQRVGEKLDLGVRALNSFVNLCSGQRIGIFAGSGVGKSVLLSMLAKYTDTDVAVIGLIGERGREVQEFIQDELGEEGLKRSVVVVATSDESALMRRQAAYMTLAVSEYYRNQGHNVLCMMDSVTRFAMAQRDIGLAGGEPPATKGYTPTVFAELPKLLERAGPGPVGAGNITAVFTVLVEGDDHNEPVADAVRGILDGHIVMERAIAERGRYPAINVLKSVSRSMPHCNSDEENALITEAKRYLSAYSDMEEMIRLGAYRKGSNPEVDRAIELNPHLEDFLSQNKNDHTDMQEGYQKLQEILSLGAG